jgi:PAS domain-containing protein
MLLTLRRRLKISGLIIGIYFFSILILAVYPQTSIKHFIFGLSVASLGSLFVFLLLRQWEENTARPVFVERSEPPPTENPFQNPDNFKELEDALTDTQTKNHELIQKQNQLEDSLQKLEQEKAQFELRLDDIHHQMTTQANESEEELRRKATLLSEYQETINQQREVIKKKQDQIAELESKVRDLNYELKTLLQLAEIGNSNENKKKASSTANDEEDTHSVPVHYSSSLVKSPEEATLHLGKCIDIAQKITSANRFNNGSSRFHHMPLDNSALDFRRLFDNLRSETSSSIIVYSLKENRLIFANQQIENLLGWTPEKFTLHFSDIFREGYEEWNHALGQISPGSETKARLLLKTKNGHNLLVNCHLKMIPTGIFRHYVIGVLYPA